MNENKSNVLIVVILLVVIAGQVASYVAVQGILEIVLTDRPTQIIVTVSGNDAQAVEIPSEIGKLGTEKDKPQDLVVEDVIVEYGAIRNEFRPSGVLTPAAGVNYFNGVQKETYYNLDMSGVVAIAQARGIEGEYSVREDGCKMYGDYIIIAANQTVHPYGSLVETSLGTGIVLDTGGFAFYNPEQVDIATAW